VESTPLCQATQTTATRGCHNKRSRWTAEVKSKRKEWRGWTWDWTEWCGICVESKLEDDLEKSCQRKQMKFFGNMPQFPSSWGSAVRTMSAFKVKEIQREINFLQTPPKLYLPSTFWTLMHPLSLVISYTRQFGSVLADWKHVGSKSSPSLVMVPLPIASSWICTSPQQTKSSTRPSIRMSIKIN